MSKETKLRVNQTAPPQTSAPTRFLQRKCTCGGTPFPTGECEACGTRRETGTLPCSGDIDESFVRDVRRNFQHIRGFMRSLKFNCRPSHWTICGSSSRWRVGGRLMWTCLGSVYVCANAYRSASDPFKMETIIHEAVHNALVTTNRAYSNRPEFNQLRPRGGGFLGRLLNILGNIPMLDLLFRALPGNNDTINHPDSYSGYAMQV